jgi:hypothetical protein
MVLHGSVSPAQRRAILKQLADWDPAGELGVEPCERAEAGVPLEVPAYLARLEDVSLAIDWYREQVVDAQGQSIVFRPGPPDLDTNGGLADKVAHAAGLGCAEVNFYAYGLYRLRSLDLIHGALRSYVRCEDHSA